MYSHPEEHFPHGLFSTTKFSNFINCQWLGKHCVNAPQKLSFLLQCRYMYRLFESCHVSTCCKLLVNILHNSKLFTVHLHKLMQLGPTIVCFCLFIHPDFISVCSFILTSFLSVHSSWLHFCLFIHPDFISIECAASTHAHRGHSSDGTKWLPPQSVASTETRLLCQLTAHVWHEKVQKSVQAWMFKYREKFNP